MDRTREIKKRVTILNKFGATHPSITGRSAKLLADFLYSNGLDVRVVSIKATYKGKQGDDRLSLPFRSVELKGLYNGSNKFVRLLINLIDGFRLIATSLAGKRDDVKIVMTDPSMINMWAVLLKPFYRSKLIFWTMDLYPDAFCSAGLIRSDNLIYRLLSSVVYRFSPDYLIALGACQYQYLSEKYNKNIPYTLLPCGINPIMFPSQVPWWRKKFSDKIILCYAGNLGEAHDDRFLKVMINLLNPQKHILLLSLYGTKSGRILQYANQDRGVVLLDCISPEQLAFVDVNVASLLPSWNHVCVPSKVVSAICVGTPVLYNATEESEGYNMFRDAIWLLPAVEDYSVAVSAFYKQLNNDSILRKKQAAVNYACQLQKQSEKSYQEILDYCCTN